MIQCYLKVQETRRKGGDDYEEEYDDDVPGDVETVLDSLAKRLLQSALEDFHLVRFFHQFLVTTQLDA